MATTTLERVTKTENRLDRLENIVDKLAISIGELRESQEQGFAELRVSANESNKRTEQGFAELRENQKQNSAELVASQKRLDKQLGDLSRRLGTVVEDLVAPSLSRILIEIADLPEGSKPAVNVRIRKHHQLTQELKEFDAIAEYGNYALLNETKTTLRPEDIPRFLETLAELREYFLEYRSKDITLIGAMSSPHLDKSLIKALSKRGLLALAISDTITTVKNPPDFVWKAF